MDVGQFLVRVLLENKHVLQQMIFLEEKKKKKQQQGRRRRSSTFIKEQVFQRHRPLQLAVLQEVMV